jgi:stage II sporulation protein R
LEAVMAQLPDMEAAKVYIQTNLPELETIANNALQTGGSAKKAVVSLMEEAFPIREYDTFTLPAGVYESLRVTIGEGEGKNWWCVVFPRLCVSATSQGFEDTAVSAGFSGSLTGALKGEPKYRVRFYLLDCLGWIQNILYKG